jgi:ubiquinone/menaquinone biosynthesis C-methylase UbiE
MQKKSRRETKRPSGWDPVADWYDRWMGQHGGQYHRQVAIPAILSLADIQPGEHVLDVGAGQGVLAPYVLDRSGVYTGVDVSERMLNIARARHSGRFLLGDARRLSSVPGLRAASFDLAVFLLSIQDMHPLEPALRSAAWALRAGGRVAMLMTHPCFRIPRQSGWAWDERRKLHSRRVDHYLSPLSVPMKQYDRQERGVTLSFHRPLEQYINGLADSGLFIDAMQEIPSTLQTSGESSNPEIPLFLALRARKLVNSR